MHIITHELLLPSDIVVIATHHPLPPPPLLLLYHVFYHSVQGCSKPHLCRIPQKSPLHDHIAEIPHPSSSSYSP